MRDGTGDASKTPSRSVARFASALVVAAMLAFALAAEPESNPAAKRSHARPKKRSRSAGSV